MTAGALEVGGLFSVFGVQETERQLPRLSGVGRISVNPVTGSTTIMFDPARPASRYDPIRRTP